MGSLRIGISTCPNDTFAFAGILTGAVDTEDLDLDLRLYDIQELNSSLRAGNLDVGKASFHAALHLASKYGILRAGSAIGQGVGPLLLAGSSDTERSPAARVLCPGEWTTATLLLKIFYPELSSIEYCLFSEIMPALKRGDADFGVVIHEGRFTYKNLGLEQVADLGELWEKKYSAHLPLGGILARRDIPRDILDKLNRTICRSIEYGYANRALVLQTMRRYAAELDDAVIWEHVNLYVNEFTRDLGDAGEAALQELSRVARQSEVVSNQEELQFLGICGS